MLQDARIAASAAKDDPRIRKLVGLLNEKLTDVEFNRPLGQVDLGAQFLGKKVHLDGYESIELSVSEKMTLENANPKLFVTVSTRQLRDKEIEGENEGEDKAQSPREWKKIEEHRVVIYLKDGYMKFQRRPEEDEKKRARHRWIDFVPGSFVEASIEVLNATIVVINSLFEPILTKKMAKPAPAQSTAPAKPAADAPPAASDPKAELGKLLQKAPPAELKDELVSLINSTPAQGKSAEPAKPKSKAVQLGKGKGKPAIQV